MHLPNTAEQGYGAADHAYSVRPMLYAGQSCVAYNHLAYMQDHVGYMQDHPAYNPSGYM